VQTSEIGVNIDTSLAKFLPNIVSIAAVLLFYLSLEYEFRPVGCGLNNWQRPCWGNRPTFIIMRYGLCLVIFAYRVYWFV